jgi:hypothetical protein
MLFFLNLVISRVELIRKDKENFHLVENGLYARKYLGYFVITWFAKKVCTQGGIGKI